MVSSAQQRRVRYASALALSDSTPAVADAEYPEACHGRWLRWCSAAVAAVVLGCGEASHAEVTGSAPLDTQVRAFLDRHRGTWRDLNVPESDGRLLYDLILKHRFTRALEIGTSTGHSGIWIAWALSKTGGRLVTIEINRRRHREALANFKEAGLAVHVDARLGDAHQMVPALEGPFDFVFSDADKKWYTNYFAARVAADAARGLLYGAQRRERTDNAASGSSSIT